MKKEILQIIIKVAIYALGLVAAYLGVTSFSSCTYSRSTIGDGRATIITVDTTYIQHSGVLKTTKSSIFNLTSVQTLKGNLL